VISRLHAVTNLGSLRSEMDAAKENIPLGNEQAHAMPDTPIVGWLTTISSIHCLLWLIRLQGP